MIAKKIRKPFAFCSWAEGVFATVLNLIYEEWEKLGEDVHSVWQLLPESRRENLIRKNLDCTGRVYRDGPDGSIFSFVVGDNTKTSWAILWCGKEIMHTNMAVRRMLWQSRRDTIHEKR